MPFFDELKRRNVFRVGVAYVIVAWLLLQVADVILPTFNTPDWVIQAFTILLILGFPLAVLFAWAFELTPEGIKLEKEVNRSNSITHATGRKLDFIIIGVMAVAIAFLLFDKFLLSEPPHHVDAGSGVTSRSIAVLPFDNQSAAAENAGFFAAGVHDELLTLLSKLGDLKVISRTSVERLDDKLGIAEIGAILGVATVLEGQVQRAGDRLRINAQLINAATENHIWANTYDRELTAENVFDVQSDIAWTIAEALQARLSASDEALLNAVPTENTAALNRYLLGQQLVKRGSFESLRQADRYFREAVELDPNYAEAWIGIANTSNRMLMTGQISEPEYLTAAELPILRALSLDKRIAQVHAQLAAFRWRSGDLDAAEKAYKTALELNPNDSTSLLSYGIYLRSNGRSAEAIPVLERALEKDPLSIEVLFELGKSEMYNGHPENNVAYSKRILEIDPASVYGYTGLVQAYMWMGRLDLIWPWYFKAMSKDPEDYEFWAHAAVHFELLGASEWADRYLERALALGPDEPAPLKCQAQVLAYRGKFEQGLAIARRALEANVDDRWASIHIFLRFIRDHALRTGDFDDALRWYRERRPGLFEDRPKITISNVNDAANLALLLQRAGDTRTADVLLDAGLAWYEQSQPPGVHGYLIDIVDVELLALKGDKEAAMDALRGAVDRGWRTNWRWVIANENLASLKELPEYQEIVSQLEKDMATQLEAVQKLPYQGEFDLRFSRDDR